MSQWSWYQRILLHNILLLLKPWRNICTDLEMPMESWPAAFTCFVSIASKKEKDIIGNIQYFYELHAAAKKERDWALMRMTNLVNDNTDSNHKEMNRSSMNMLKFLMIYIQKKVLQPFWHCRSHCMRNYVAAMLLSVQSIYWRSFKMGCQSYLSFCFDCYQRWFGSSHWVEETVDSLCSGT